MLHFITQKLSIKTLLIWGVLAWLPMVSAQPDLDNFPDVTFKVFSNFVQQQFAEDVSLATVLIVLFSLTGWIKVLCQALQSRLGEATDTLLQMETEDSESTPTLLAGKLDALSKLL